MSSKVEKNKFVSLPVYAGVLFVAGIAAGIGSYIYGGDARTSLLCAAFVALFIPVIAALVSLIFLPVLIHELGHIVAGRLVRFTFEYMRVGPLQVQKTSCGLKWSILPPSNVGGLAGMLPLGNRRLLQRFRIFVFGGIAASALLLAGLIIADACVGITFIDLVHFKKFPPRDIPLSLFTYLSAYFLLTSIVPHSTNSHKTDGAHLLESFTNPRKTLVMVTRLNILSQLKQGIRAKDWDLTDAQTLQADWLEHQNERPDILLYYYFLDRQELVKAEAIMDSALSILRKSNPKSGALIAMYFYEAAFIYAIQGRLSDAKESLTEGEKLGSLIGVDRKRAITAVLTAEGNLEQAHKMAAEARTQLEVEGDLTKPNWQAEADWLQWALAIKPLVE